MKLENLPELLWEFPKTYLKFEVLWSWEKFCAKFIRIHRKINTTLEWFPEKCLGRALTFWRKQWTLGHVSTIKKNFKEHLEVVQKIWECCSAKLQNMFWAPPQTIEWNSVKFKNISTEFKELPEFLLDGSRISRKSQELLGKSENFLKNCDGLSGTWTATLIS